MHRVDAKNILQDDFPKGSRHKWYEFKDVEHKLARKQEENKRKSKSFMWNWTMEKDSYCSGKTSILDKKMQG